jgi:putative spermidine/putrescine transport system ATP-binding protein
MTTSAATAALGSSRPSPGRTRLSLSGLRKEYGTVVAVDGISLDVRAGEFFTLLGPSGSGKTTVLMMVAGFVAPTSGTIVIDGAPMTHVPPDQRNLGVVFQNYALFPHMTVADNLAFPLVVRRSPELEIKRRVEELLALVGLEGTEDRYPSQLSGGQQQRVAFARAVIFRPPLLLMDEPLGALDRKLRARLQLELRELQRRLEVTIVYVTHDQDEALTMSDRIAVMSAGTLQQIGTPVDLYERPATVFVAGFLGDTNRLPGARHDGASIVLGAGAVLPCGRGAHLPHGRVTAVIRPERIRVFDAPASEARRGRVVDVVYLGNEIRYWVDVEGVGRMLVSQPNSAAAVRAGVGQDVYVAWLPEDVHVFADRGGAPKGGDAPGYGGMRILKGG